MNRPVFAVLLSCGLAGGAGAQTPAPSRDQKIEQVIVTGERTSESEAHTFVEQHVMPSPIIGKLTRWSPRNPLCPSAAGFSPANAATIVRRIKEIASLTGAPLSKKQPCKPNMAVIATTVPQALMDEIHAHRSDLMGYDAGTYRADAVTTMKYPVQALYETATIDDNGTVLRDMVLNPACGDYCTYISTGGRARDGIESAFYNVTIIIDARDIPGHPLNALADYLAMLALSQTDNFAPCQETPSISTLMSRDCPSSGLAETATASDIAYLKGLYEMDSGASTIVQKSTIASEIRRSLEGR